MLASEAAASVSQSDVHGGTYRMPADASPCAVFESERVSNCGSMRAVCSRIGSRLSRCARSHSRSDAELRISLPKRDQKAHT
eukprot:4649080-Pleurochrysis_carterae.AAC.1